MYHHLELKQRRGRLRPDDAAVRIQCAVRRKQARLQLKVKKVKRNSYSTSCERVHVVVAQKGGHVFDLKTSDDFLFKHQNSFQQHKLAHSLRHRVIWATKMFFGGLSIILIGGVVFSILEYEAYEAKLKEKRVELADLEAYFHYNQTVLAFLRKHHAVLGESFHNPWDYSSSVFFAFTIATTIGYGSFAPTTTGGLFFTCMYGFISIPFAGYILVNVATSVLRLLTYIYTMFVDKVEKAFDLLDSDKGGSLDRTEMRMALEELDIHLTDDEFEMLMETIDADKDNEINKEEFRHAVTLLHADLSEVSGRSAQMAILVFALIVWIGLGTLYFSLDEKWHYGKALYFSFITLTTVGLGDYTPSERGYVVLYAYTFIGLGMLAVAINLVTVIAQKMKERTIQAIGRTKSSVAAKLGASIGSVESKAMKSK